MFEVNQYKVDVLPPNVEANAIYYVKPIGESKFKLYITSSSAEIVELDAATIGTSFISDFTLNDVTGELTIFEINGNSYSVNLDTRYVTHALLEETAEEITQHLEWQGLQW